MTEFKIKKNNVKSENLRDYIKDLELAIFGHDDEEPEYEESIAERTKMRRQNKESDKKDASITFAPPDKLTEIFDARFSESSDDEKTEEKVYEEGYDSAGYDGAGYDE